MLRFDTHIHTSETSGCSHLTGEQTVDLYKEAGYDGICITDHYIKWFFDSVGDMSWDEKISLYLRGYQNAVNRGKVVGLHVVLGMEIRLEEGSNDYLVFGVTEEFLANNQALYDCSMAEFVEITRRNGLLVYQAHPFRPWMTPQLPSLLDGVEVINANPRHDSKNDLAAAYAADHHLKMLSGSDCHETEDVGRGGIFIEKSITSSREMVDLLNARQVDLIRF